MIFEYGAGFNEFGIVLETGDLARHDLLQSHLCGGQLFGHDPAQNVPLSEDAFDAPFLHHDQGADRMIMHHRGCFLVDTLSLQQC